MTKQWVNDGTGGQCQNRGTVTEQGGEWGNDRRGQY